MQQNFRSYQLAVKFYKRVIREKLPSHLKDQFLRASSSIALNLSEGSAKPFGNDRRRFYRIALGSSRECEAIIELLDLKHLEEDLNKLVRHIYNLCNNCS